MQIPTRKLPLRDYQKDLVNAYNDPAIREIMAVIARRGGKTTTFFGECIVPDLVREKQTIVLVYPTAKMGFRNFWNNIENDKTKTIENIPQVLIKSQGNTEDDMRIELINGSVFMVLGATNVEALRGANGMKYLFDEFADMPIEAVNVVAPITEANGGKMIYMGTPKIDGINGETMRRMHESFKKKSSKYTCYIDATNYMTQEQLKESREGYITRNGNDFKYRQEMLLDWGQASSGSYYGQKVAKKYKDGTIGAYPYNKEYPVYTVWDLGRADSMAVIFWQYIEGVVHIIDTFQSAHQSLKSMIPFIQGQPYVYGYHFLPWDGVVHSGNDNVRRIDYLRENGIINAMTLRKEGMSIGIDRVIENLPTANINQHTCTMFLEKIVKYKRKFNPKTGDYIGAEHDTNSHYSDALRYLWTAISQNWIDGKFAFESVGIEQSELEVDIEDDSIYYF